jgi:hypothetical protein
MTKLPVPRPFLIGVATWIMTTVPGGAIAGKYATVKMCAATFALET